MAYVQRIGLYAGWIFVFRLPITAADLPTGRQVENILMKLGTKADSYSSAGTEAN
jgi:hypothetical protein